MLSLGQSPQRDRHMSEIGCANGNSIQRVGFQHLFPISENMGNSVLKSNPAGMVLPFRMNRHQDTICGFSISWQMGLECDLTQTNDTYSDWRFFDHGGHYNPIHCCNLIDQGESVL
jgi:hypothetical protein